MLNRFATLAAVCMLVPVADGSARVGGPRRRPDVGAADAGPPPDTGVVASEVPGIAHTQDGRTLTVSAKDETQLPVAPLTTALSSRDWLVGGTFTRGRHGLGERRIAGGRVSDRLRDRDGQNQAGRLDRRYHGHQSLSAAGCARHACRLHVPDPGQSSRWSPGRARSSTFRWTRRRSRARLAGHAQGCSHQDRQLRRRVVLAVVRSADQFRHGHRRHRRLLRRHEDVLMTAASKLARTITVVGVLAVGAAVASAATAAADPPPPVPADPAAPAEPPDPGRLLQRWAPWARILGAVHPVTCGLRSPVEPERTSRGAGRPAGRAAGFERR